MIFRVVGILTAVLSLTFGVAAADPTPAPSLGIPGLPNVPQSVLQNPLVQSVINAASGLLQTTNGPIARGRVTYFKRFDLQLRTAPNVYRTVRLHQGTIIDPRGATLAPGMSVEVDGVPQGDGSLAADKITVL